MKKYILIGLFIIFAAFTKEAKAQIFLGEAFVGYNICQVDGDRIMGFYKKGVNVGVGVIAPIWRKNNFSLELSLEVAYNQKGAKQGKKYSDGVIDSITGNPITGEYDLSLNYGEVPIMIYFTDKNVVSAGFGLSYARLMEVKEYEHGVNTHVTATSGEFKRDELNILADVKIRVYKRWKLGFRYSYSLTPIRTREYFNINHESLGTFKQYNNMFTFRLTYVFNEKLENLQREEYRYTGDNPKFHERKLERQRKRMARQQAREERRKNK
ncbi:MAG: outer membrane beta-barrel protein [Bacteroidales bacterium]|nr:outer membrane beta-barrel protein [Bacteroidales bacterium]